MNIKVYFAAALISMLAVSCNNNDDPKPTPPTPGVGTANCILFATAVTNPEGNSGSVYLQAVPDLQPTEYDNKNGIPTGFGATPIALPNGHIYSFPDYMGNSKAELQQYVVVDGNRLVRKGGMLIPGGASACNVVEKDAGKAYLSCQGLGIIIVFNPTTMKEIKRIDLSMLSHKDTRVSPSAMIIRDGLLYVGLSQFDSQWMPTENSIELALIDTEKDEYVKTIKNELLGVSVPTRPMDSNSIFMDENQDIYINCIGSFGMKPDFPGGIVRIKKGQTEIDPNFCIRMDQTKIEGLSTEYAEFLGKVCYDSNGQLYAYANSNKLDPEGMSNPYTIMSNCPVIIDLKAKTIKKIEGLPISNPQGIAIGKYKNLIVFGSANRKYNGLYTYNPATQEAAGPIVKVQGWPSFFHSYVK